MNKRYLALIAVAALVAGFQPASADISSLPAEIAATIIEMGPNLNADIQAKSRQLMKPLLPTSPAAGVHVIADVAYGSDPLQKMDIAYPEKKRGMPIVIVVHGGNFNGGDKENLSNIPTYLAAHGMVGVTANYRLAPTVKWPDSSRDLGAAVAFMKAHAADYGGNPRRIFLMGHSAGANLVASYVFDSAVHPKAGNGLAGAVLSSGPAYRLEGFGPGENAYYGDDKVVNAERAPGAHIKDSKTPLLLAAQEFDPLHVSPETYDLAAKLCVRDGKCPRFIYVRGHNHISGPLSIGTKDDSFGHAIVDFVRSVK
jgi:acetyl esterase/lipase